jgi:4'-phosphopantetheinyl transferase
MDLVLADAEAHVWRASLDVDGPALEGLAQTLSDDERGRAERFRFDRHRHRFVAGRGVLRAILARYLASPPSRIRFRYGPWGKPMLALDSGTPDLRFSVSHADGLVLVAIARGREIGVDVERIAPRRATAAMIEHCLTHREGAALRALPPDRQPAAFFRCWTRKEAVLKGRGEGLTLSPQSVEVSLDEDGPPALLAIAGDAAEASRWSLRDLASEVGYVAALAVKAP